MMCECPENTLGPQVLISSLNHFFPHFVSYPILSFLGQLLDAPLRTIQLLLLQMWVQFVLFDFIEGVKRSFPE